MMDPIVPIDKIKQEARAAAARYEDVNDACPYPFGTEAGRIFRDEFATMRAAMGMTQGLKP